MNNPVMRWQIVSPTPQKTSEFYCKLFGWESTRDNLLNYEMLDTGSERGIHGGVWPAPPEATSFVQLYIEVENCETSVKQAVALGAGVLMPPQALPDGDVMAVLRDPCGMTFGIMQTSGG